MSLTICASGTASAEILENANLNASLHFLVWSINSSGSSVRSRKAAKCDHLITGCLDYRKCQNTVTIQKPHI